MLKIKNNPRNDTAKVTFSLAADGPPTSVVGDFNDWDPLAHPMRRRANGTRSVAVEVPIGSTLRFRYLADGGAWINEPEAHAHDGVDDVLRL